MKSLYLIDASGFLYRSYFAIRMMTNAKGESTNALFGFIRSVQKLIKDFNPDRIAAIFDGPSNIALRKAIYNDYKAHRAKTPPDLIYQIEWAHRYCSLMGIPELTLPGVEADDTMGTVALWAAQKQAKVYLCTSDKDLCQLVDDHISILNTHKDNLIMGPKEVEENFGVPPKLIVDYLAITGDSSDNVPGLAGLGPKTASELLQKFGSLDYILEHPEEIPGAKKQETLRQDKDKALMSRELVKIHTAVDIPQEEEYFKLKIPQISELKEFYGSMNFHSLIKELDLPSVAAAPTETKYTLVDDEIAFAHLIEILSKQQSICIDTKTTDFRPLQGELVGIGFGIEPYQAWYVPANGQLGLERLIKGIKPLIENPHIKFYGHNVKYHFHVLQNYGLTIHSISFDTLLASYILNSHIRQHNLDTLSLELFGKAKIPLTDMTGKGKNEISIKQVPIENMLSYCSEEVDYTCRLKELFEPRLLERGLNDLYYGLELPLLKVLAKMERRGVYIDAPLLQKLSNEIHAALNEISQEIFTMAGETFNLNSPRQISDFLFNKMKIPPPKKTATGHSTSAEVLEFLRWDYPIAGKLLQYRTLEKLRSTYIEILPLEINPKTERIHCTFNQTTAATGRLSCQDPNLQNIPVRTEMGRKIREAFRPQKEEWSYLAADYSQIELRILAHLSEDPTLISAFQNKQDIHAHTAATMLGIPLEEVSKEQRQSAKAVNFGIIYGQQAFGLSQELGIDVKQAAKFIDDYFHRYPNVKQYLENCKNKARTTGKATTLTGRERSIPEINSKNMQIRQAAERLAINTPFQGTAADLIKIAMLKIDELIDKSGKLGYMVLQIHDELIFEIPDQEISYFEKVVRDTMENVISFRVPLVVDIAVGKNWKEC